MPCRLAQFEGVQKGRRPLGCENVVTPALTIGAAAPHVVQDSRLGYRRPRLGRRALSTDLSQRRPQEVRHSLLRRVGPPKPFDQFRLPVSANRAVASECRQHLLVAEVLRPGLELLWGTTGALAKLHQSVADGVGIEIGQARPLKRFPEQLAYRRGGGPGVAVDPGCDEAAIRAGPCLLYTSPSPRDRG